MPNSIKGTVYIHGKPQTKNEPKEEKAEIGKLKTLADETETVIYKASSVFPFQLFPDKIIIDKNKVSIIRKMLFFKRIFPILYEDIQTVKVNRGILLAAVEFEVRGYEQNPRPVLHLWPEHASKIEKYVLGLVKAKREFIDITKLSVGQIKKQIGEIGGGEEEVTKLM